jgi:hypothetical protein
MTRPLAVVSLLVIVLILTACPATSPNEGTPTITSFTATPSSLPSGGEVTLSWTVTGADTVAIDQGVGTVTGSSKLVTVTTTTTFTLTASKGDKSTTKTTSVTVSGSTQTVTGKVLTYDGKAGSFLPVLIGTQTTTTDANGNFSVTPVTTPYDLVVLQAAKNQAYVYQGLSRTNPIILVSGAGTYDSKTKVTFTSTNVDTTTPVPAGSFADGSVTCAGVDTRQVSCGITGSVFPTVDQDISWAGTTGIFINAYALQVHKDSRNVVTNFLRFGRAENELLQNGQPNTVSFALEPVQNRTIAGSITPPPGYTLTARALGFKSGDQTLYPFSYELDNVGIASAFTWASPAVPGMSLYLTGTAKKGEASVYAYLEDIAPDATGISLTLPTPPEQLQPANNALGVTSATLFSWTPFAGGVHILSVYPLTPGPLTFTIYTAASEATIPDLSSLGYSLAKGVTYKWSVGGSAPFANLDDLANGVPYFYALKSSGGSGDRTFTTAP